MICPASLSEDSNAITSATCVYFKGKLEALSTLTMAKRNRRLGESWNRIACTIFKVSFPSEPRVSTCGSFAFKTTSSLLQCRNCKIRIRNCCEFRKLAERSGKNCSHLIQQTYLYRSRVCCKFNHSRQSSGSSERRRHKSNRIAPAN